MPQDTPLFNDTIRYNIAYGNREATFEDLERAAREANILQFIESQTEGWDTMVGERGLKLSGGEVRGGEERSDELPSQFLAPLACLSNISVPKLRPILLSTHSKPLRSSLRSSSLVHCRSSVLQSLGAC